jgi:hypothetical protein
MSRLGSYKNTAFSESQKFLVLDPSTSSASLVLASELVAYITPKIGSVLAETTRLSAENTDYKVGEMIQTSGATAIGDGLASIFLVVAGGDGDFPMINGNDLLVIVGDDALRAQLISEAFGKGASLVSMEGGPTVEVAVNRRTVFIGSVAESFAGLTGANGAVYDVSGWQSGATFGGGQYVFDSGAAKSLHDGGKYISPTVPAVSAQAGANFQARRDAFLAGSGETVPAGTGVFELLVSGKIYVSQYGGLDGVDSTQPFAASVATGLRVYNDVAMKLSAEVTVSTVRQVIESDPMKIVTFEPGGQITLSADESQVHWMTVFSNDTTYCISQVGKNNLSYNCKFSGDVGHYVFSVGAENPAVLLCEASGYGAVIPFVYSSCTNFSHSQNKNYNTEGFGVQARFCTGGKMDGNEAVSPFRVTSQSAVNGQTAYTFTVSGSAEVRRAGLLIRDDEGVKAPEFSITTASYPSYTVTLTSDTSVVGTGTITLYDTRTLENYQVNSGCFDIVMSNNTADGSGDANIVVGADYHFNGTSWVLDPNLVVFDDLPKRTVVRGNDLRNARDNNIAVNNLVDFVTIIGNTCYNAGYAKSADRYHDSNIGCSTASNIEGNTCITDGFTRVGIASFPTVTPQNFRPGGENVFIGGNKFSGSFKEGNYNLEPLSQTGIRKKGIKIAGEYLMISNLQEPLESTFTSGAPANTDYFTFAASGGGGSRDTSDKLGGVSSVVVGNGAFLQVTPTFYSAFRGIVTLRCFIKGTGSLDVFWGFSGSTSAAISIPVSNLVWEQFEVNFPVKDATSFLIRFIGGSGGCRFQYPELRNLNLNMR